MKLVLIVKPSIPVPVQKNPPEAFQIASMNPSTCWARAVQVELPVSEARIVKSAYVSMLCSVDFQVSLFRFESRAGRVAAGPAGVVRVALDPIAEPDGGVQIRAGLRLVIKLSKGEAVHARFPV
jgi:hypothetical protein